VSFVTWTETGQVDQPGSNGYGDSQGTRLVSRGKGVAMRYMLVIYGNDEDWTQRSPEDLEPILAEHTKFTEDLRAANALVASEALQPSVTATSLRLQGDDVVVTDGPYIETKEQLAGFYLIEAENLDRALEWAKRLVRFDHEPVEVRPVVEI
jgi:hypothetical protein